VKAAADKLKGDMKDKVKEAIEKYKPKIIDGLNNVKVVVIDAGKKVVIQIRNEIVTIITGAEVAETDLSNAYGIKDVWNKVKDAAKKLVGDVKVIVIKAINENKPLIMAELEKMKQVLIDAGKKVLIQIVDDVVKIIIGDQVVFSDKTVNDIAEYGFSDMWAKVKAAANKLSGKVRDDVKAAIEKLKPQILDHLNTVKEIVIDGGKKIIIQVKDDIVRIIVDALKVESDIETYGLANLWEKVKSAAKKLDSKVRGDILKVLNENKPKILEDLNRLKDSLIKTGKQILVTIKDDVVQVIVGEFITSSDDEAFDLEYGFTDVWAKVKAAADKLKGDMKDKVKEAIEKYKPKIIDGLNNVKVVVIDAGKKVVIQIRNEIVTIITGADVAETDLSNAYGIKDVWNKVKDAAKKLVGDVKIIVIKVINENKPLIMAELEKMKQVLIDAGKKVLIQIVDDVVKIIIGDQVVSSDKSVNDVAEYGFSDMWNKVKDAASKLKGASKAKVQGIINKYKPKILAGLTNVKQVIISEGKRIVITIRNNIVQIITDAEVSESSAVSTYGIKNWWGKVKEAVNKFGDDVKSIIMKQIEAAKPQIMEQLKQMKEIVIDGVKKVLIKIVDDVVQVIIGDQVVESTRMVEDFHRYE